MNATIDLNTPWRKVASTIYKKPVDSKIFGEVELDVTELEKFVTRQRKSGLKITLTHVFVLIIARGIKKAVPELNVYLRRGKIIRRPAIDAMVSVLQADGGMGSVKVKDADTLSLKEVEAVLREEIQRSRKSDASPTNQKKSILSSLPWPFRNWFFKIYSLITLNWGFTIPFVGLSANTFGSFVLTNIGSIGLDKGFPALMPSSNVASVVVMGGIKKKPVVVNDEVVIRRIMSTSMVIDHRVVDASHGGKLLRFVKELMRHPEELL